MAQEALDRFQGRSSQLADVLKTLDGGNAVEVAIDLDVAMVGHDFDCMAVE